MEDLAAIAEINNLDMVTGKRTNKRRRITRLKTKLDDFNGMPLRELRDEDLTDLKYNLHKEIKLHNALQNRYEAQHSYSKAPMELEPKFGQILQLD